MSGDENRLASGEFSTWLLEAKSALQTASGVDVPCGDCTACCRSSQFIHVERTETDTLSCIPKDLLFPAPGQPAGNMLMGYDEQGRCPMLVDDKCSIYAHRPKTCRSYDCRVFPAAGIKKAEIEKPLIANQALRWQFTHDTDYERDLHSAVQATADFLRQHPECFAGGSPSNATHLAAMAIKVHTVFLRIREEHAKTGHTPKDSEIVEAIISESKKVGV